MQMIMYVCESQNFFVANVWYVVYGTVISLNNRIYHNHRHLIGNSNNPPASSMYHFRLRISHSHTDFRIALKLKIKMT